MELVKTEPDIIDVQEASQFLDLTVGTIYVLNTQKKIPVLKYGRKLKFSKAVLQEWNEAGRPALEDNTSTKLVDAVLRGVKLKRSSNT